MPTLYRRCRGFGTRQLFRPLRAPTRRAARSPGALFISVDDAPRHPAVKFVDVVASIDGWYITEGSTRLQGIARRVQYVPEPYESFTIRASPLNAARTSAEKSSGSSQAAKWPPLSTSLK